MTSGGGGVFSKLKLLDAYPKVNEVRLEESPEATEAPAPPAATLHKVLLLVHLSCCRISSPRR